MGAHGAASALAAAYPLVRSRPPVALLLALCAVNINIYYVALSSGASDMDYSSGAGAASQLLDFKSFLIVDGVPAGGNTLDSWNNSSGSGGGAAASPCNGSHANWVGVLCSWSGQVRGLRLENMGLSGQIHVASLASFPYLRTLSFINNTFRGPLPPNINILTALKSLYLSNNAFSGDIPTDAFAGLLFLNRLFLQDNQFTGPIPSSLASSLPRLRHLNLARNLFQGTIPDFQQKRLSLVTLSDNLLEGPIPESLSHMPATSFSGNEDLCDQPLMPCSPALISPSLSPIPLPPGPAAHKSSSAGSKIAIIVLSIALALVALALILVLCYYRSEGSCSSNLDSISSFDSQSDTASPPVDFRKCPIPSRAARNRKQLLTFIKGDRESFDMHDLMRASAEVLGSGNFGASYKAAVFGGRAVVVKRYKALSNNVGREEFKEHMATLGRLCHRNLLPLLAYYYRKEEKLLVFDFVDNGSLASHLHGKHSQDRPGLDWPTRLNIIKGVVEGLAYLHAELPNLNLPHGHLKSSNVLLNQSFQPLLMDYALAPLIHPHAAHTTLMVAYKSPECAQLGRAHKKADVFSLGVLILEVLTGKFPTSYLTHRASGNDADLMTWVDSITRDFDYSPAEVFDKDMGGRKIAAAEGEILKLLRIGLACCEEDVDKRCDLREVAEKVEQVTSEKSKTSDITSLRSFEFHHGR